MPTGTVSIFSNDGGGERGYLSLCFYQKFLQLWGVAEEDVWKAHQLFVGTSVGGIIALGLAYGLTPTRLKQFFKEEGPWIFTIRSAIDVISGSINASYPSNRPNGVQKAAILRDDDQWYRSVSPDSNYGSARLKQKLIEVFGDATLQDLKSNVIIPSYKDNTDTPVWFSNLEYAEFIGQNETIVNVALATSAAPFYLPPSNNCVDGGLYQNNPAHLGYVGGKMLKKTANKICLLSLGTGLGKVGFDEPLADPPPEEFAAASVPFSVTISNLFRYYDATLTGNQEAIAKVLSLQEQYTLDKFYYYRFQPQLDYLNIDTDLDNTDPAFLTYLEETANQFFNEDIDDITNYIGHVNV